MLLILLIVLIQCSKDELITKKLSFSFVTSHKRKITLDDPTKYINKREKNYLLSLNNNKGCWYYVHFVTDNFSKVHNYISIHQNDEIHKNTFELFLTMDQIKLISDISLVKKIDPIEKFYEDGGSIEKIECLIVYTTPKFDIPLNDEDYIIENRHGEDSSIIKISRNDMNDTEFNIKKNKVIQFLTEIPEIKKVSTYTLAVQSNSLMTGFTQKNSFDFKKYSKSSFYYLERYLNNNGITGLNQIITILDTPIDFYHTMFRDDKVAVEFNKYMPNHRKFVYYGYKGTLEDWSSVIDNNEHGTHVAGTAAGKSVCKITERNETSFFNGNAPDAKIVYGGNENDFSADQLAKLMNTYNSKISSNSWGILGFYNPSNHEFGKMAYQNPSLSFIFAAGNEYDRKGNFTIRDPSGSKNVITVGALDDFYSDQNLFLVTSINNPNLSFWAVGLDFEDPWLRASVGTQIGETDIMVIDLDKGNQCENMDLNDYFLLYGDNIDWIEDCDFLGYPYFLYAADDSKVLELLESKSDVFISKEFEMNANKGIKRAYYSSTGPANKGILKPDIIAPGNEIVSAKSTFFSDSPHGCIDDDDYNEDPFTIMDGTSMATPNVAGGVALIHQYFQSGKWIDKVTIDGPTTRALLINSCTHPTNSKSPDNLFGHGVVDLSTILPIENDFGVQITHQGQNNLAINLLDDSNHKPSVEENGHVVSKIKVDTSLNKKKLQITLSYLDPLLNSDSPVPLTRDLDLVVTSPSKKIYLGDHLDNKDSQHASANEKVIINQDELENGEYTIHVYGNDFVDSSVQNSDSKQEFSVVATGPINNGYLEFTPSNKCPCDKCDQKRTSYCQCNENTEVGPACQAKIETVNGSKGSFTVQPLQVKRIRFIYDKKIRTIFSKSSYPGIDSTIWASQKCHLTLGEYDTNGVTEKETSSSPGRTNANFNSNEVCVAIFNNNDLPATYNIEVTDEDFKPKKKHGSSKKNSDEDDEYSSRANSKRLGDFNIQTIYVGSSSIIIFQFGYNFMQIARKFIGRIIPPPNFFHTAIWVGSSDANDDTIGAIFVYGKYKSKSNDQTYISKDGHICHNQY